MLCTRNYSRFWELMMIKRKKGTLLKSLEGDRYVQIYLCILKLALNMCILQNCQLQKEICRSPRYPREEFDLVAGERSKKPALRT
jgi:hypothetical protein